MSRQRASEPAIRRPRSLIWPGVLILVVSWGVTLLATAPITLIPVSRLALPPGVQLTPLNGTFWHGQWRLNLPRMPAMTIKTDFLPLSIMRLQLAWHVRAQTDAQGSQPDSGLNVSADVALGSSKLSIRNVHGRLDAGSPWVTSLTVWPLNGLIDVTGDATLVGTSGGLDIQSAQATANWRNAQVTTTEPLSLGDLVITADVAPERLNVTVKPASASGGPLRGELVLSGVWPLTKAPIVQGYLQPTMQASNTLTQQLSLFGRPDASGKITVHEVLPGRY